MAAAPGRPGNVAVGPACGTGAPLPAMSGGVRTYAAARAVADSGEGAPTFGRDAADSSVPLMGRKPQHAAWKPQHAAARGGKKELSLPGLQQCILRLGSLSLIIPPTVKVPLKQILVNSPTAERASKMTKGMSRKNH
ncbi:hypothetical protein MTO96_030066 [Rhipicephalus appendiculatus]